MRLTVLTAATALLLCQTAAFAQTNTPPGATSPPQNSSGTTTIPPANPSGAAITPQANSSDAASASNATPLRGRIREMLQKSGFTDIRVMPSSFMIRAKDQNGNPVIMSVSPDQMTELTEMGANGASDQNNGSGDQNNEAQANADNQTASQFVTIGPNFKLSSNLIGLDVYDNNKQDIGQIKDVAVGPAGRARAYILSVGGFLGMGTRYVAVNPRDIHVAYNSGDQKWHATMDTTKANLRSAPQFTYSGKWDASKS